MSKEHREILRKHRIVLGNDVQAIQVMRRLTDVLSEEDEEEIKAEKTSFLKAEKLLDILPRKGPDAFIRFVDALWKVQPHLARILSKDAGLPEPSGLNGNY